MIMDLENEQYQILLIPVKKLQYLHFLFFLSFITQSIFVVALQFYYHCKAIQIMHKTCLTNFHAISMSAIFK